MPSEENRFVSEEVFRNLFERNPLPMWVFDAQSLKFLLVNEAAVQKYQYSKNEFLSMTVADIRPAEEKGRFLSYYKSISANGHLSSPQGVWKHRKKGGEILSVTITSSSILLGGRESIASVITDVTENEKAKQELRQSEERYRLLFENNQAAVFRAEIGGKLIEVNQTLADILGYGSLDELRQSSAWDAYYSADEREQYLKAIREEGFVRNFQLRMKRKDGSEIWIIENAQLIKDSENGKEYIEGTFIDITETKRMQQALQEREENYKSLIEHTPDGIWIHDNKGRTLFANPAALKMIGLAAIEQVKEQNILIYVLPEYHEKIKLRKEEMKKEADSPFLEVKVRRPDGQVIEVETKASRITYHGQEAVEVVMHDVSLQRQLEREHMRYQLEEESNRELKREIAAHIRTRQRLNANQKYIRLLIDSSLDMIFACDQNGILTEFNRAAQQTFGYTAAEINGKPVSGLYADKKQAEEINSLVLKRGNFTGEVGHIKGNGETFSAYLSAALLKNERGEIIGTVSISRDMTHIKETEEQLKRSVHEKEILLKEIHHRVKNNLQVISSILKLQSAYVKDEKTVELLNECRNRISSMAFIHASLYMTNDFANINFSDYVGNIASNLQQSYVSADKKILLKLDVPKVNLHIDDAIPCGLIINELLSNSFKYAFAKKKRGTVGISVKVKKENIILAIWDNGCGFPKNINYKNTESLGLQLVNSLAEQIGGKLKMESEKDKGTQFIIAFRKTKMNANEQTRNTGSRG